MKHRKARVPQTGAVNIQSGTLTGDRKADSRVQSMAKLKVKTTEPQDAWLGNVLPSNIKVDHLHKKTSSSNSQQEIMLHVKSGGNNLLSRTCLYKDDIQNTKVIYFDNSKDHNL